MSKNPGRQRRNAGLSFRRCTLAPPGRPAAAGVRCARARRCPVRSANRFERAEPFHLAFANDLRRARRDQPGSGPKGVAQARQSVVGR
jgi:hypothetical protein